MRHRRPRRITQLYREPTEDGRKQNGRNSAERWTNDATASSHAGFMPMSPCDKRHRRNGDNEDRCQIAMADFDDEVRAAERRKPVAKTLGPVVAAPHSRARDAHDGA